MSAGALVEQFYDRVWNHADEKAAWKILDRNLTFRSSLGHTSYGLDGFLHYLRSLQGSLANYTCVIEDMITNGNRAAAKVSFSGLHRGTFFGAPPTGREIVWTGMAFFTVANDRIADVWVLGDIDSIKRQLALN